jgi:hypothetical protein
MEFPKELEARFIEVMVKNFGPIPVGKPGAGHGAWLFIDEVEVL